MPNSPSSVRRAPRAPASGGRENAREQARARILGAARELFAARGFASSSIADIAAAAGFAKGLVHHYFGSKRELWHAVIDEYVQHVSEREAVHAGASDLDAIAARLGRTFSFFQKNSEYLRIAAWAELEADDDLPPSLAKLLHEYNDQFRRAQRGGAVRRDVDPVHAQAMTYHLLTGWFHTKRFFCPAVGRDPNAPGVDAAYLKDVLTFVRGGLAALAAAPERGPRKNGRKRT